MQLGDALMQKQQEIVRFRHLADICPLPMFIRDDSGQQIYVNKAYLQMLRIPNADPVLGYKWQECLDESCRIGVISTWLKCARDRQNFTYENRYKVGNEMTIDASVKATPLTDHLYAGFCMPSNFSVRAVLFEEGH